MAVAGAGKSCFRFKVENGELVKKSTRQEVSSETMRDIPAIIAKLQRGEVAYVSSVYPTTDELWAAWAKLSK